MAEQRKPQRLNDSLHAISLLVVPESAAELSEDLRLFYEDQNPGRDYYAFADELIFGVIENVEAIDNKIREIAATGTLSGLPNRSLHPADGYQYYSGRISLRRYINEAIDLSKQYSAEESRRFERRSRPIAWAIESPL